MYFENCVYGGLKLSFEVYPQFCNSTLCLVVAWGKDAY